MSDCICGGRGYYDDPDEPREKYCTCAAAFRLRKRDDFASIPERTVFVSPVAFAVIVERLGLPLGAGAIVVPVRRPAEDATEWRIEPDPDCPLDYAWPESAPAEAAAVVRQGIEDAANARKTAP